MSKKVLVISTSLRAKSNSETLADAFADGAKAAGNEVEKISLKNKSIAFCKGCLACQSLHSCVIKDDAVHLAEQMTDETTTCIALLHDVLEDTALTLPDLEAEFPREITEAVQLLTHAPSDDYLDYVRRLCENPLARKVKIADLAHNSDETRLSSVTPDPMQLKHWRTKYAAAKEIIREYENIP